MRLCVIPALDLQPSPAPRAPRELLCSAVPQQLLALLLPWGPWLHPKVPWQKCSPAEPPLVPRNDYDRHVFRMQKHTRGSRGTWDKVKKKSVMLGYCPSHLSQNPGITAPPVHCMGNGNSAWVCCLLLWGQAPL